MPQIWELIERCDEAQRALSDFGQEPDVKSAKKTVAALRRDLVALDKRLARIVEYYDSARLGLMGWSKRSLEHAATRLAEDNATEGRRRVREAGEYLRRLDQALRAALT
jgi:hypothetical protein